MKLLDHSPHLIKEWNFKKNININIENISYGSGKKVWWKCKYEHEWLAVIGHRTSRKQGCPYCSNKKVCKGNCLETKFPEIAVEWNSKNNFGPSDIVFGSTKKVWWKCKKGHEWKAIICSRVKGNGCPYCSGLKTCKANCLAIKNPKLAKEWNYSKNKNLTPYKIAPNSHKKVWWKCENSHEWKYMVKDRHRAKHGCPYCSGKKATIQTCLATLRPDLLEEWDYNENTLSPYEITLGSDKKVWWKCKKNHKWAATVSNKVNGSGCPYCSGAKVCIDNCLATKNPTLSKEWNYDKNTSTPFDFTFCSGEKVWWKCRNCSYEWNAQISNRTNGSSCPICSKGNVSKISQVWLDSLIIPKKYREKRICILDKYFTVDAYNPRTKTIYEFYGDFWHGNPKIFRHNDINPVTKTTYKELYNNTIEKENIFIKFGYKVISIWENDFKEMSK